jgi:aspartate/methionine/tyrosine aminotransferase
MKLQPFELERWQSIWENKVEYNLAESGVHPLRLSEVLDGDASGIMDQMLGYTQTNGTEELRRAIASTYSAAGPENVLVTNGSSEATFVTMWHFLERGAEVAIMLPNYMQAWGLAKTMQATVRGFSLKEYDEGWDLNLRSLKRIANGKPKLIAICNPNNPTGTRLSNGTIDEICEIARRAGAWILSDEIYHGAELDGEETSTFWGRYEKVIVTGGLSKAYGLPGLRVGWAVTKPDLAAKLWAYHDYTTICPTALSDLIARKVLRPEKRKMILSRTRRILQENLPILLDWVRRQHGRFSLTGPEAGAVAFAKYSIKINSTELAERLVREKSTLIVPGDQFGLDGYIRIGYGSHQNYLKEGLNRLGELVSSMR